MEMITKTPEKIVFTATMTESLANAFRRSVADVQVLAIDECDFYKNDSVLYDEILAHRLGLIPLKNQKVKDGEFVELVLKIKGKDEATEIFSGELGELVVFPDMPLVILNKNQELEVLAKARQGTGKEHAKFLPGLLYYKKLANIKISKDGEGNKELAESYPEVFSFDGKLKVKDITRCDLDEEDVQDYKGVEIVYGKDLVFTIESWGQMDAKEIFVEAGKALKSKLSEVSKVLK